MYQGYSLEVKQKIPIKDEFELKFHQDIQINPSEPIYLVI
jgi:hypothetical protein